PPFLFIFYTLTPPPPPSPLFPYTTLFRSRAAIRQQRHQRAQHNHQPAQPNPFHQRVKECVDHRHLRLGTQSGVHHVQIFAQRRLDRKSTRLNSSHSQISYAVFCLKKKKNK